MSEGAQILRKIELPPDPRFQKDKPVDSKARWNQMIDQVCVGRNRDQVVENRRRELIAEFKVADFVEFVRKQLPDETQFREVMKDFHFLRGFVFEYLANKELNDDEESNFVGEFILQCLKNPRIVGLDRWAMRNPDHLGVVVDAEKGEAYITGMYEVKMGRLSDRARSQMENFYHNLDVVIKMINGNLEKIREKAQLLPPRGITLKSFEEIYKFIVSPLPETELEKINFEEKENELKEYGWGIRKSVFTYDSMNVLAKYISDNYIEEK